MIKVLVVDDDKLVRQGLITSMPWDEFDMEVVGEAKNGEKALEFLQHHPVDLLLVDLAMPVMSGIDLLRIVRKSYPHLFVVVLTMHQDFEYIQEALRLGAIDYIAKVELERETFGTVLQRIRNRIEEEVEKSAARELPLAEDAILSADKVWVFMADIGRTIDLAAIVKPIDAPAEIVLPDLAVWPWPDEHTGRHIHTELMQAAGMADGIVILRIHGVQGKPIKELVTLLQEYRGRRFFYERRADTKLYDLSLEDLTPPPQVEENELNGIKTDAATLAWVHRAEEHERLLERLKMLVLPPEQLNMLLRIMHASWNNIFVAVTSRELDIPDEFSDWEAAEKYLNAVRQQMLTAFGKTRFSGEVQKGITRALQLMHEQLSENVNATEIARKVGMSRSYFSQCFKEWTGVTFNEYLRRMRMEKAKGYLRHTNRTIAWIAENTGYADEKYFSRTFAYDRHAAERISSTESERGRNVQ